MYVRRWERRNRYNVYWRVVKVRVGSIQYGVLKDFVEECVGSIQLGALRYFVGLGHFGLKIVHEILV